MTMLDRIINKFPFFDGILKRPVKNLLVTLVVGAFILHHWGLINLNENLAKGLSVFLGLFVLWVWNPQRGI